MSLQKRDGSTINGRSVRTSSYREMAAAEFRYSAALFVSDPEWRQGADKTGRFIGAAASDRARITQWSLFQMGGIGPFSGQF